MHGTLVSNKVGKDIPHIRIVLRDLNVWTIDESNLGGILVYTIDAVYHLDSPRKTALTDNEGVADLHPNAKKSNMNNVHMPLRAMCGLVYNMLDIFGQAYRDNGRRHVSVVSLWYGLAEEVFMLCENTDYAASSLD